MRKNFFRGITVNDVVSDEASFTLLEEDAQEIKTGDQIIHKGVTWYVNKQIAQDTIGKTVTFGASKNTKGERSGTRQIYRAKLAAALDAARQAKIIEDCAWRMVWTFEKCFRLCL